MTHIDIRDGRVDVDVDGLDRLWAMRRHMTIPTGHVVGAAHAEDEARWGWHGIRLGGMHVPGLSAGTFWSHGEWVFRDVHNPAKAITVRLQGELYDRLVVEVDDPATTLDRLRSLPPADDPASVPPRPRWTTLTPMLVALVVGVMIAVVITLIEVLA